ncbi:uncharacterized protein LOC123819587 [Phyllostomus hastatus]|uniref:uncharacterized protein LOC123819587 n=1 Tax=Phyllostomus hastatus TaxID=9423 RepID=UPI001E6846CC|nr:uncharacterized protein LOC123819587 [Phyllostomus hastatus]
MRGSLEGCQEPSGKILHFGAETQEELSTGAAPPHLPEKSLCGRSTGPDSQGWIEAYPTTRETADTVAALLIEHIVPRFGLPASIQSDNGPVCVSQVVQQVSTSLGITWKLHIPYHPQSSGKVEHTNGILKSHLTKSTLETKNSWPTLLPFVLARIRAAPRELLGLSLFELLYGRPFLINNNLPVSPPPLASYLPYLSLLKHLLREYADRTLPPVGGPQEADHTIPLQPGDQVVLRELKTRPLQPKWTGPHTVILTTPTAAKLLGLPSWVHVSCLKLAPASSEWSAKILGNTRICFTQSPASHHDSPLGHSSPPSSP